MMNDEWWLINDEWWMMNDEWWMMNDEWWMMDDEWWCFWVTFMHTQICKMGTEGYGLLISRSISYLNFKPYWVYDLGGGCVAHASRQPRFSRGILRWGRGGNFGVRIRAVWDCGGEATSQTRFAHLLSSTHSAFRVSLSGSTNID